MWEKLLGWKGLVGEGEGDGVTLMLLGCALFVVSGPLSTAITKFLWWLEGKDRR